MKKKLQKTVITAILLLGSFVSSFAVNNTSSLDFDGINDYVRYADDATLGRMDGASSYTIEAWVRLQSGANTGGRIVQRFSLFNLYYGTSNNRLSFGVDSGGSWHYYHSNNNSLPTDGNWHHVAAIRDAAAGTFRLYVDGVNVSSGSWSGYPLNNEASRNLYIGDDGAAGHFYKGTIDEVRLKNVAVSLANLHYHTTDLPYVSDANTAGLFHFDENTGSVTTNAASGVDARLGDSTMGDAKEPNWADVIGLPLPVKLIIWKAKKDRETILLNWETAGETNNKGFEIEKSINGKDWKKIGWLKAFGAAHHYTFTDKNPITGANFYRLKQLDWDGIYTYSSVKVTTFTKENRLSIFPNPTTDFIIVKANDTERNQQVKILNQEGKMVISTSIKDGKIDVQSLKNGIYYLQLVGLPDFSPLQFIKF